MSVKLSPEIIEIRAILIGWVKYEGIYCVAAERLKNVTFSGLNNGAGKARIFGVRKYDLSYEAPPDSKFTIEELYKIFINKTKSSLFNKLHLVYLYTMPDSLVFLIRPLISNPVIVTILPEKNKISVSLYTAKSLFSALHLKRYAKYTEKRFPDNVRRIEQKKEKEKSKK